MLTAWLLPGALCAPNLTVLIPNEKKLNKEQSFDGLRWHPVSVRGVNFSPTWLSAIGGFAGKIPTNDFKSYEGVSDGMKLTLSEIEQQTNFTMELLTEQLEANNTDWENCFQVRMYLIEPRRDFRIFKRAWKNYFDAVSTSSCLYTLCQ